MLISQRIRTFGFITLLLIGLLLLTPLSRPQSFSLSEEQLKASYTQDEVLGKHSERHNYISNTADGTEFRDLGLDPFEERNRWERDFSFWNTSREPEEVRKTQPSRSFTIPVTAGTPHDSILITSDADFASQGWPGAGTPSNPYRIENLNITANPESSCIDIQDTRVHFVIANCTLHDADYKWAGIDLQNVSNGFIVNNTLNYNGFGIRLNASSWNIIYNNTIAEGESLLIYLNLSPSNSIINNTIWSSLSHIKIRSSNNIRLVNNTCSKSIVVDYSFNVTISTNTLSRVEFNDVNSSVVNNNKLGWSMALYDSFSNQLEQNTLKGTLYLFDSGNNSIIQNYFSDYGIFITSSIETARQFLVQSNTINSRPLVFWQDQIGGAVPPNAAQIILINCTGTIIRDLIITRTHSCIRLLHSRQITVQNNTCTPIFGDGINLYNTNASMVVNNTCIGQGFYGGNEGIELRRGYENIITNNNCTQNTFGFLIVYGSLNVIHDNTVVENRQADIQVSATDRNTLTNNTADWINLWYADSNNISSNYLGGERSSALFIEMAGNNTICDNHFVNGGIFLDQTYLIRQRLVANNTVNGKPLIYLADKVNWTIPSVGGQIVLVNCSEMVVSDYTISDCHTGILLLYSRRCQVMSNSLTRSGILVLYTNSTLLEHNTCTDSDYGIRVRGSNNIISQNTCARNLFGLILGSGQNNRIVNNLCTQNVYIGISVHYDRNLVVSNNTCNYNLLGLEVASCENGRIVENNCSHNLERGILIDTHWGANLTLIQNTCHNNAQVGIYGGHVRDAYISGNDCQDNGGYGIGIFWSGDNNIIEQNWCLHNGKDGLYLEDLTNSRITYNVFGENHRHGIAFNGTSTNNTVMWNVFAFNEASNGFDNTMYNFFDYNFWSDYQGFDLNFDGIGDTPYVIQHPFGNSDNHPLLQWPGAVVVNRMIGIIFGAALITGIVVISVFGIIGFSIRHRRMKK